ncbi:hypothetical protein [Helicobacter cappadocius]|uniref:Uncharacterized protein n=1 Tax=Helicobacter cappadocius TaxID=3063998 RepID=A0AA90SS67_9HELI|nr:MULTISPECIES: hypothetical protein [unclassified Helicobacter]MDO7252741.1 hypothetical protein [Helicobacter sp. faydin-H75]MDP2538609.1 hypothetical protein [Helicobacter sp. faydin-H76]
MRRFFTLCCLKNIKLKVTLNYYLSYYIRKIIFHHHVEKNGKLINTQRLIYIPDFFQNCSVVCDVVIKCFYSRGFRSKQRYEYVVLDICSIRRLYLRDGIYFWRKRVEALNIMEVSKHCCLTYKQKSLNDKPSMYEKYFKIFQQMGDICNQKLENSSDKKLGEY